MSPRQTLLDALRAKIGRRKLVFVGIRGHDAAPLLALPQFQHCFAVSAPLRAGSLITDATLEEMLRRRLDLDTYDYDLDDSDALGEFRVLLLNRLREHSLVTTYRPSHFLWNAGFASVRTAQVLGMYKDKQAAYEYKPWVETEVARLGIHTVPWRYVPDESRDLEAHHFAGPTVLRPSRMAGGVGVALARGPKDIIELWPAASDQLVAVGPYLDEALPINVGAAVYSADRVVVHPGSIQLIGIEGATNRHFGYCGNDFAAFAQLDASIIATVDDSTRRIGRWLGFEGYRGAFGVDYLWHKGDLYFSEVNPRLQGSTSLSSSMAASLDVPDIVLDHVAANLGIAPTNSMSLLQWAQQLPATSHVVVHNTAPVPVRLAHAQALLADALRDWTLQLVPDPDTAVAPGAILVRLVADSSVTRAGHDIDERTQAAISAIHAAATSDQPSHTTISHGGHG